MVKNKWLMKCAQKSQPVTFWKIELKLKNGIWIKELTFHFSFSLSLSHTHTLHNVMKHKTFILSLNFSS